MRFDFSPRCARQPDFTLNHKLSSTECISLDVILTNTMVVTTSLTLLKNKKYITKIKPMNYVYLKNYNPG